VSFLMRLSMLLAVLVTCSAPQLRASDAVETGVPKKPSAIVIGFVGGFVQHDNPHHGPVQFAERLRQIETNGVYVRVFENRHRKAAYRTILKQLDRDGNGILSPDEKAQARIVLYGQSWGASAAVILARDLNQLGIPVLLTVQIDSVAKFWQQDKIIPPNVAAAVNFYQPHGFVHGRAEIKAGDPSRTQVLGNYRFDYKQTPVKCEGYSWRDRNLTHNHMEIECDPRVWAQVEELVRQRLEAPNALAANPGQ